MSLNPIPNLPILELSFDFVEMPTFKMDEIPLIEVFT
jgi:hypothetical protein